MKRTHSLSLLSFPLLFLLASVCFAVVSTSERGNWPDHWPQELEPLRPTSRTIDIATGIQEQIYEIPISDRETFDRIWPAILKLRTPGSPLTLYRVDTPPPKAWGSLLSNKRPCVRIYTPSIGYSSAEAGKGDVRQLEDQVQQGRALRTSAPWPPEITGWNGELPEFVVAQTDPNGRRTWVPGDPDLAKDAAGFYHRARIDVELVIDGEILDLNRIRLPERSTVIDHRFDGDEK